MRSLRFLVGLLVVLVTAVPAAAQTAEGVEITDVNTARYPRVTMVVEVQNASQLDPAALAVTENGQTAGELTVEKIGESAVEVGIVLTIDTSGSMDGAPMEAAKRAALSFVTQMRSQDRVAIVGFGDQVTVYAPFTNSKRLLATAIDQLAATGETSLYDAVETSAQLFSGEAATLERNLILLSDGRDTASAATLEQAVGAVEDQQVRVFGVALQSPDFDPAPVQQIVQAGEGLYLETPEPGRLTDLYGRIQRELDNRLVVRFTATQQQAGDLQIGVAYGNVATQTVVAVPGFATTLAPVATAPPAPKVVSVPSRAVADPGTLMAIAVAAAALASTFVVIIFAGPQREGSGSARRLAAFGRRQAVEEKRSVIGRIPLLRRFSEQAEAVAKKKGLLRPLNTALEQADIPLSGGEAVAGAMAGAVVLGLAVGLMATSVLHGLLAFVVGVLLVLSAVRFIGAREKRRFENQL
ncbi:MAG: vWA domain-containing protein, partial [Acidimicrobiia bacterium]